MYLLSLRLAPSPWVGTRCSATAQYTVPSVSTQTMTPRRVGFLFCSSAPPRAEPAGPSVWCTMTLRHGCEIEVLREGRKRNRDGAEHQGQKAKSHEPKSSGEHWITRFYV